MRRLYNEHRWRKGRLRGGHQRQLGHRMAIPADAPLWCAMYDTLGTARHLELRRHRQPQRDVDVVGDLPTACPSDFMVSVTATNNMTCAPSAATGPPPSMWAHRVLMW
jgi:hypothetical protein